MNRIATPTVGARMVRGLALRSGWLLGATAVSGLANVAQGALVTRALGVDQFGVLAVITTFVVVVNRLTSFRTNELVVKYLGDAIEAGRRAEGAAVVKLAVLIEGAASVVALLVVGALAPLANGMLIHTADGARLVWLYAATVLGGVVAETSLGVLHVYGRFRLQSGMVVAGALATLGAVAVAYVARGGLPAMVAASAVGSVIGSALMAIAAGRLAWRELGAGWWRTPLATLGERRRTAFRFAMSTNGSATLSLVTRDADVLWLGLLRSATEVGLYKLAFSVASIAVVPLGQLGATFYPAITRLVARAEWLELRALIKQATLLAALYAVPVGIALAVAGGPLIGIVYGAEFARAAPALALLVVGMGFANVLFWNRPALLALGRPDIPLKVNIAVAVVKLIGLFTVVRTYGYIGNAALLAGLYVLGVTLCVAKVWSELRHRLTIVRAEAAC